MTDNILNVRKLILEKYDCDLEVTKKELADCYYRYDDCGRTDWHEIYKLGYRYFKVWGFDRNMVEDCVEVFQKREMIELITYHEN